jgi:hypothetical protein
LVASKQSVARIQSVDVDNHDNHDNHGRQDDDHEEGASQDDDHEEGAGQDDDHEEEDHDHPWRRIVVAPWTGQPAVAMGD